MHTIQGSGRAAGFRFAVVVSKYNDVITDRLQAGALSALHAAESGRFDAIVCLGCLIRGETAHFEYISSAVSHGLTEGAAATGVTMSFGVLTTNSIEEALARAAEGSGNKGHEAAVAAIEMAEVVAQLTRQATPRN